MTTPQDDTGIRAKAYAAAGRMARERMSREAPLDAAALAAVDASDIVVVEGSYDRVEQVLDALGLPHVVVQPEALLELALRPEQLLVVNCPGHLPPRALPRIRDVVAGGGTLFTTDWALRHVVEPAFPGLVAYNDRPTADDVVRIEIRHGDNPFLAGVLDEGDDPQWWLEASSYPIRVLDPERVEVLLTSAELGERYGEPTVAVRFRHGEGEVLHMISHYYLQRTELRTARHAAPAMAFAAAKGTAPDADLADLTIGDVESAASSARFLANVVAAKKRRHQPGRTRTPTNALFVYGTLMPGHLRWPALEPFVEQRRLAMVRGRLYDTGNGYPGARFDLDGTIEGWVLELRPGARSAALATLDRVEGTLFRPVTVTTSDGVDAITYEWAGTVDGLRPVTGRWAGA